MRFFKLVFSLLILAFFACNLNDSGNLSSSGGTSTPTNSQNVEPLRSLAELRGIYIGAAVDPTPLKNEAMYSNTLVNEFNMVVAENHMKFENLEPSSNNFDFSLADRIVGVALSNNMKIRGHVLLWHNQSGWAAYVNNPAAMSNILSNHIFTVMRYYSNKVEYWDVVNEAIDDNIPNKPVSYYNHLRKSFWWTNLGNDYIEYAFQLARQADPTAKLFYNDYGIEATNFKSDATFLLVSNLKAKGLVDGIGFQMHISADNPPVDRGFNVNLQRFGNLGLEIHVTEMDVRIPVPATEQNLTLQADTYKRTVATCLSNTNVKAIVLWGFTDKYSWIPQFIEGWGAALIFDENYNKKKAYYGVAEALESQ